MDINRRDLLKGGAAGFLLGFLFRGRGGKLIEEPEVADQPPSAITITTRPQQAFRPERLMIAGTVVGKEMVPETKFVPCTACETRWAEHGNDDDDNDTYCETCDDLGGKVVETGELVERNVMRVPWSIEDITIGDRGQLAQSGAIPGDMFSASAIDNYMSLDATQEGQPIRIVVRYTGDVPDGELFHAALIGTTIGDDGVPRRTILPVRSERKIVA